MMTGTCTNTIAVVHRDWAPSSCVTRHCTNDDHDKWVMPKQQTEAWLGSGVRAYVGALQIAS
jgi:hypothetical protein